MPARWHRVSGGVRVEGATTCVFFRFFSCWPKQKQTLVTGRELNSHSVFQKFRERPQIQNFRAAQKWTPKMLGRQQIFTHRAARNRIPKSARCNCSLALWLVQVSRALRNVGWSYDGSTRMRTVSRTHILRWAGTSFQVACKIAARKT